MLQMEDTALLESIVRLPQRNNRRTTEPTPVGVRTLHDMTSKGGLVRVYEEIVKRLESIGIEAAFGGALEHCRTTAGLKHSPTIRGIVARHEQAASFKACGYAMYTNKLGVCFATAGPGNISENEIDKEYKADYALVSDARPAVAAIYKALDPKVSEVSPIRVQGRDCADAGAHPPHRDRCPYHPLGDPALQPITRRCHPGHRRDDRREAAKQMIEDTMPEQRRPAPWKEQYFGGSAEAEYEEFQQLASRIMQVQSTVRKRVSSHGVPHPIQRAFHAKATLAVDDAELRFNDDLPADLRVGFAQPGAAYRTIVRFSNAAGSGEPDFAPDMRGIALRIQVDDSTSHDLLATNFPVSHARNARQFVEFAEGHRGWRHLPDSWARAPGESVRNPRDRADAAQRPNRAQTAGRQRRDPDVLEPRSADVGAGAGRAVFAAPGARRAAGSETIQDRPELPVHRGGPAPAIRAISASSCASSVTSTTK